MWKPTKPVNLFWQIVFVVVSPLFPISVWAFLRIQKLRLYLVYVIIPFMFIVTFASTLVPGYFDCEPDWMLILFYDTCAPVGLNLFNLLVSIGFTIFGIYLVQKWSNEWNKKFP